MRTQAIEIYTFSELSDDAKSKALEKAREYVFQEPWDYECVIDDAIEIGKILGFDLMQRRVSTKDGKWNYAPSIFFSGFWSQGDGACFEGSYAYEKGSIQRIKEYQDKTLSNLADRLAALQKSHFYKIQGAISHRGHYYHERSMSFDMSCDCARCQGYPSAEIEDDFREICADFALWIYKSLEREYEYQSSDEQLSEMMQANNFEFYENGSLV